MISLRNGQLLPAFELSLPLVLLLHVLVWTWVGVAMNTNFDGSGDMVETYVWGQNMTWGYFKHPPVAAWVVGVWFKLFPKAMWAYWLLSASISMIGLMGIAALAKRFVPPQWVWLCVAGAALTPGFTAMSMRFNVNVVALAIWPWLLVAFVQLMDKARLRDAVWLALMCSLAVMSKYFGAVLVIGLLLASLIVPQWRAFWKGALPYVTIACSLVFLTPHFIWLYQNPHPLHYAHEAGGHGLGFSQLRALIFVRNTVAYLLPAIALVMVSLDTSSCRGQYTQLKRHYLQALSLIFRSLVRPVNLPLWAMTVLPVLVAAMLTVVTGARTSVVWGLPMAGFLVVLTFDSLAQAGYAINLQKAQRFICLVWLLVVLAAPLLWWQKARMNDDFVTPVPYAELTENIESQWHRLSDRPMTYVGGTPRLAASVAFYSHSHPTYWSPTNAPVETPWVNSDQVSAAGGVIVCELDDAACINQAKGLGWQGSIMQLHKNTRGFRFPAYQFWCFMKTESNSSAASVL